MRSYLSYRRSRIGGSFSRRPVLTALLLGLLLAGSTAAQLPPPTPAPDEPHSLPLLHGQRRPAKEISSFVEKLSSNDAAIDIITGQSRIVTFKEAFRTVAIGDPTVIDFTVLNPRQIRLVGNHIGISDLSIITPDNRVYAFEVRVVADLDPLRLQLRASFPDASVKLSQIRDHIVVEGEARDSAQVSHILDMVRAYMVSVQAVQARKIRQQAAARGAGLLPGAAPQAPERIPRPAGAAPAAGPQPAGGAPPAVPVAPAAAPLEVEYTVPQPQIINLLHVPGPQQVLLKVRIAELNRTAMREIGADLIYLNRASGSLVGTNVGSGAVTAAGIKGTSPLGLLISPDPTQTFFGTTPGTTVFGIFEKTGFEFLLNALRNNSLLKILAEPNLIAMNGQQASFLAGGEFPIPVPQVTGGIASSVTVIFKEFGVRLSFTPYIQDDETIRLTVDPEVSTIDRTLGVTLTTGGGQVPGLNTRKAHTTVEMHQGQTLAIAGLLQLTLDGSTTRIPGLGDLPILGPFFSNTTNDRVEKELLVLVTPYLAEPMNSEQVPPSPGDEVKEPNDLEFYLLSRIEGRTGIDWRSTTHYDDALHLLRCYLKLEKDHVRGPYGYCE
jgi:pilus assembly protein CpaC